MLKRFTTAVRAAFNAAFLAARISYHRVWNRYEAASRTQGGMRSSINQNWGDSRYDVGEPDRIEMARKARYFEANSPIVQRMADIWEQYTVGANGLVVSSQSADFEWADRSKAFYDGWSLSPDRASLASLAVIQSLASRLFLIDGECFILLTRTTKPPYRPRIQLIESHRVATPPGGVEGQRIVDGCRLDEYGRTIGYYVRTTHEGDSYIPVSAENMIHICEPSRPGMVRGITHFYAVMNALHDLEDLQFLEMKAAKRAARTTAVIQTETGEYSEEDDWPEVDQTTGATPANDANIGKPNENAEYYENVFGGDEIKVLKTGDVYKEFASTRPSVAQQWYWRYLVEQVCSGVGIPMAMVYPDSMQGTSYRGMNEIAAGFFRARSKVLSDAFYRVWLYVIEFGSRVDVTIADKPADWKLAIVRPPRSANVDQGRNSTSMLNELEAGVRTFSEIYAELGEDWREQLAQKAKEAAFIESLAKKHNIPAKAITKFAVEQLALPEKTDQVVTGVIHPDKKGALQNA